MIENYRNALARGDENEKKRHLKKEAKVNEKVTLVILICLALIFRNETLFIVKEEKKFKKQKQPKNVIRQN
jgi:hypothetical protein